MIEFIGVEKGVQHEMVLQSSSKNTPVHPKPKKGAKPKAAKNAYKPWRDQDLALIIETQGTAANVTKWAAYFGRSEKAIICIYRWALASKTHIDKSRSKGVTGLPLRVWQIAHDLGIVCQGCP